MTMSTARIKLIENSTDESLMTDFVQLPFEIGADGTVLRKAKFGGKTGFVR